MKTRYFIVAIFGYDFAAKFAIWGTKNMQNARTGIPLKITANFKKNA
jgi:hypothetical protein